MKKKIISKSWTHSRFGIRLIHDSRLFECTYVDYSQYWLNRPTQCNIPFVRVSGILCCVYFDNFQVSQKSEVKAKGQKAQESSRDFEFHLWNPYVLTRTHLAQHLSSLINPFIFKFIELIQNPKVKTTNIYVLDYVNKIDLYFNAQEDSVNEKLLQYVLHEKQVLELDNGKCTYRLRNWLHESHAYFNFHVHFRVHFYINFYLYFYCSCYHQC